MSKKAVTAAPPKAREFPLSKSDWTEIYYALDGHDDVGAMAKITEEVGPCEPLTDADWVEIYLACKTKLDALRSGFYGRDRLVREWTSQMVEILRMLEPIRTEFVESSPEVVL